MIYAATINAPRWFIRSPLLAWIARVTGRATAWEVRGRTLDELDREFRRLAARKGMIVAGGPVCGWTLLSLRSRDIVSIQVIVVS
jgi:hypothetical protein